MAEQTRRELLEAAWDKADEEVAVLEESENEPNLHGAGDAAEADTAGTGEEENLAGKPGLRGAEKTEKEPKKPKEDEAVKQEAAAAVKDDKSVVEQPVTDKAPQSWKPAIREHWGKIPAEARAEIKRIDLEVQRTLSQTANVRKFANDFANVVNPFAHIIKAQASTPLQAVHNLMTTAAGLVQGSQPQKAAILAEIIQNYGVDLEVLDDYLSKNWDPKQGLKKPQLEAPPAWAQPVFSFMQTVEQQRAAHEERVKQDADAQIEAATSKPFFDDLRDDIADVMEIATKRGLVMTIDQAYDKAVRLRPDIEKLIPRKPSVNDKITRARRAASLISGAPSSGKPVGGKAGPKTRKEQLTEAWDNAE